MKVLVIGSKGQLGQELTLTSPENYQVIALDKSNLDICDREKIESIITSFKPGLVINAAAYTAVDKAEEEPEYARAVNAVGACNVAEVAYRHGARVIHISTDFVFDGRKGRPYTPKDPPNPLGVYGKTKYEGEQRVINATQGEAIVLRTSWLYSAYGKNFVGTIKKLLNEREKIFVVADQVGTPTWARGLAQVIWQMADKPEIKGIYHWTDSGIASWYDVAVAIEEEVQRLGMLPHAVPIIPVSTDEYPFKARRPFYSVLDKSKTWEALGYKSKHWRKALRECLKEEFKGSDTEDF